MFFRDLKTNCIFIYVLKSNKLLNLKIKKCVLIYLLGNVVVIYDYDYADCGGLCKTRRIVHWRPNVRHSAQGLWNMLCEVQVYPIQYFQQQGAMWNLLYRYDHSQQEKVSLESNPQKVSPLGPSCTRAIHTKQNNQSRLVSTNKYLLCVM